MPVAFLFPDAQTDAGANVASGALIDVDEGITGADAAVEVSIDKQWAAPGFIEFGLDDLPGAATSINSVILRVRARIVGTHIDDNIQYAWTIQGTNVAHPLLEWDFQADDGAPLANRQQTVTDSPTVANINAALIRVTQTYAGVMAKENITHDWDCFELEVDYNVTAGESASGAATLAPATASGAATKRVPASGGATLAPITASGTAKVHKVASGGATLEPATASGTAEIPSAGASASGSAELAAAVAAGTATKRVQASGAATLAPITASGSAKGHWLASGAATLEPVTASGSATKRVQASGAATLAPATASGTASLPAGPVSAAGGATLAPAVAAGTAKVRKSASGAATLAPITASGSARRVHSASGAATLAAAFAAGVARLVRFASGAATLAAATASGNALAGAVAIFQTTELTGYVIDDAFNGYHLPELSLIGYVL